MEKRLQSILSQAGVVSRRKAALLIESGKVKVDGRIVKEKGFRVDADKAVITVNNKSLSSEKKYYFLLYKPKNVVSTALDTHKRKTVTDFFKHVDARLYPIGRLDKDTTGLIILTNDGELTHKLSHPSFEVDKEYIAIIKGRPEKEALDRLENGVMLEGKKTSPCVIKVLREGDNNSSLKVILHEGRKRQIREMFKIAGSEVLDLKRVKYAGFKIGKLREGESRELTEKEIDRLKNYELRR